MKIEIQTILDNPKTLFRIFLVGYFCVYLPFGILFSILSLIGKVPVNINSEHVYGISGSILMLLYIPFFALIFASINWLMLLIGLWIYTKFKFVFENFKKKKN